VDSISPQDTSRLAVESVQLVDVRAQHEWDAGRIGGAVHLPLPELSERAGELDRERPVVVYCLGDNRAEMAAEALAGAGLKAMAMEGGIQAWVDAGLPIEPDGGYVAGSGEAAAILASRKREKA
jgi:rhodanese-related sulfurtransferase